MRFLIGTGSSHPLGFNYLQQATVQIDLNPNIEVKACADLFPNPAFGGRTLYPFFNSALAVQTALSVDALWLVLRTVEQKLGRMRFDKNGARTIDLDLLWCFERIAPTANIKLPHPGFFKRASSFYPGKQAAKRARWDFGLNCFPPPRGFLKHEKPAYS